MTTDIQIHVLHGPNAVSRETLIVLSRRPGPASPGPAAEPIAPEALASLRTALAACGLDAPDGTRPLPAGWADLVTDLATRILAHLGLPPLVVAITGRPDEIAFVAGELQVSLRCLTMAVRLLQEAQIAEGVAHDVPEPMWRQLLAEIERARARQHARAVTVACGELGLPCHRPPHGRELQIGEGRHRLLLDLTNTSETSLIAARRASDKVATNRLLAANGLPVARQWHAATAEAAWRAALAIGLPVVVKPRAANHGRGVTLGVASVAEMTEAFAAVRALRQEVLVESLIQGNDYRVMVVAGQVTGVIMSQRPQVVGDGRLSIRALVDAFNGDLDRYATANIQPITLGPAAEALLRAEGRSFDFVPAPGETVILDKLVGARRGGIPVDATESIHPETAAMLVRAAAVIGLDVAGIDYRSPDIGQPWHVAGGGICEVNSGSGTRVMGIRPQWVRDGLVAPLAAGRALRMRHVAIIGRDAERPALDALARGFAAALERQGWRLGLALSDALWLDHYRASAEPLAPFDAYRRAIECPLLDAAIYVVTPETVAAQGFGLARLDLALFPAESGLSPAVAAMLRGFCVQAQAPLIDGVTRADLDPLAARLARTQRDPALRPGLGVSPSRPISPE